MSVLTLAAARLPIMTRSGRASRTPARYQDALLDASAFAELQPEAASDGHEDEGGDRAEEDEEDDQARGSGSRTRKADDTALRIADDERPFVCSHPSCGKTFKKRNKLNRHMLSHADERKYACGHPGCGKKFLRAQHLAAHQQTHSGPSSAAVDVDAPSATATTSAKSFVCIHTTGPTSVCGKRFWTQQKLDRHLRSVHEVCPPGETFDESMILAEEEEAEEQGGTPGKASKLYYCDEAGCDLVFRKRKHLRAHIWDAHSDAPHLSPYTAGLSSRTDQAEPIEGDVSEEVRLKPFACSWPGCTLRFPSNSHRRVHEQRHEEKKARVYTCALSHPSNGDSGSNTGSGMLTFPTWSLLRAHMREAHPPRCPRPECADPASGLGRAFKSADGLKAHLKRHEERDALLQAEQEAELAAVIGEDDDGDEDDHLDEDLEDCAAADQSIAPIYGDPAKTGYKFACTHRQSGGPSSGPSTQPCTKRFKTARALDVHTRVVHLGERRFQCSRGCGKRFGYKCTKDRHEALGKCVPVAAEGKGQGQEEEMEDDDYFREEGGAVPERDAERPAVHARPRTRRSSISVPRPAPELPSSEGLVVAAEKLDKGAGKEKKKQRQPLTGRARGVEAYGAVARDASVSSSSAVGTATQKRNRDALFELFTGGSYAAASAGAGASHASSNEHKGSAKKRTRAEDQEDPVHGVETAGSPSKRRKLQGRIYACPWRRIVELQRAAGADVAASADLRDDGGAPAQHDGDEDHDQFEDEDEQEQERGGSLPECAFRFSRMYDLRRHVKARHGVDLSTFDKGAMEVIMQQPSFPSSSSL
ncbi:hypothetical protein OC844_004002 [Tilletia horrida]|nr:hypothetical protein OC844_004002 [Tilletia horrida]